MAEAPSANGNFDKQADGLCQQLAENLQRQSRLTLMTPEQQCWLLQRALCVCPWLLAVIEEPNWQRSIRAAAVPAAADTYDKVTPEVASSIKPGDVLNVSYYKLPHKVVVENCSLIGSSHERMVVQAIHYGRLSLLHSVTVMREKFELECDGVSVWLHKFPGSVCYSAEETLARAVSRVGERQHHPTTNNAAALAQWCKVRDYHLNRELCEVPRCDDDGRELHQLKSGDHVNVRVLNQKLHGVLASIESLDDANDRKIVTLAAQTDDIRRLQEGGLRVFVKGRIEMTPRDQLERLRVPFQVREMRQNAEKYANVSLCWESSELQAMTYLATGVATEPKQHPHLTVGAADLLAGHVILYNRSVQFVLAVHRPEQETQNYAIETVQYAPLQVDNAYRANELRFLVSLKGNMLVEIVRHNEPDLQCPVLLNWNFADAPLVTEKPLERATDLRPGDAVCIREDTTAYPLASEMPGLHAIVKSVTTCHVEEGASEDIDELSIEVICYTAEDNVPVVGVRGIPVKGHKFSVLEFNVNNSLLANREDALQRAIARLGTGQYCCAWSNSRDLVRWCCVNHKANAPFYICPVRRSSDLLALPALGQTKLRFQQTEFVGDGAAIGDVRLVGVSPLEVCDDLLKLSLLDVSWRPHRVRLVTVEMERISHGARIYRVKYDVSSAGEPTNSAMNDLYNKIMSLLMEACLINASIGPVGVGVTDRDFCVWVRRSRRAGLNDLAVLLSAVESASGANAQQDVEQVLDPRTLYPWDHVVVEEPHSPPLHLLVADFDCDTGALRGYTYGCVDEQYSPSKQLDMFVYFPPQQSPYPMQKIIQRLPAASDASSQLSASLAAGSHFPNDASAWAQLAVLELESDLLRPADGLSQLLKLLLRFAFRVAANEGGSDGSLEASRQMLASPDFAAQVKKTVSGMRNQTAAHRLSFLVRLIACLLGANLWVKATS